MTRGDIDDAMFVACRHLQKADHEAFYELVYENLAGQEIGPGNGDGVIADLWVLPVEARRCGVAQTRAA